MYVCFFTPCLFEKWIFNNKNSIRYLYRVLKVCSIRHDSSDGVKIEAVQFFFRSPFLWNFDKWFSLFPTLSINRSRKRNWMFFFDLIGQGRLLFPIICPAEPIHNKGKRGHYSLWKCLAKLPVYYGSKALLRPLEILEQNYYNLVELRKVVL